MNKQIITGVDTNLISLQTEEISNSSIVKNELLIKEFIYSIKQSESYIASNDVLNLHKLEYINSVIANIVGEQDASIDDVVRIIKQLENYNITMLENYNLQLENSQLEAEQEIALIQLKSEQQISNITFEKDAEIEALNNKLAQVTAERDSFENKYQGQKNRKVIKFIDKVAK